MRNPLNVQFPNLSRDTIPLRSGLFFLLLFEICFDGVYIRDYFKKCITMAFIKKRSNPNFEGQCTKIDIFMNGWMD
jgi:hypothetical protein